MPGPVFLGAFSNDKSINQTLNLDGFAWIGSEFYSHQRRQDSRYQTFRHTCKIRLNRGWSLLRDGKSVCQLWQTASLRTARAFFVPRAERKMQFAVVEAFRFPINTGLANHQHIQLTRYTSQKPKAELFRIVTYTDPETGNTMKILTN